jgi:prephenate dehydrogenase
MAGSEMSGIEAAQEGLFAGAAWAIVRSRPFVPETDENAQRLAAVARALGSRPLFLDAVQHDRIVALVSHLPHILSFAYAGTVAASAEANLAPAMAAGSYRDMMRVSRADRALWNDIFRDNRAALLDTLTAFETQVALLKQSLLDA